MELYLLRHGETLWNRERRNLGRTDVGLTEQGRRQAREVAAALEGTHFDAAYSSPLRRAWETALLIASPHELDPRPEPDLCEMDHGRLEGLTVEQISHHYPGVMQQWLADPTDVRMPGGETLGEVQQRAWEVLRRVYGEHGEGRVMVVAHNLINLCLLCRLLEMPLRGIHRLKQNQLAVNVVDMWEGGCSLRLLNGCFSLRSRWER